MMWDDDEDDDEDDEDDGWAERSMCVINEILHKQSGNTIRLSGV